MHICFSSLAFFGRISSLFVVLLVFSSVDEDLLFDEDFSTVFLLRASFFVVGISFSVFRVGKGSAACVSFCDRSITCLPRLSLS